MAELLRRLRSWLTAPVDEAHVDLGDDVSEGVPDMVCVINDAGPHPDIEVPPIRYELGDATLPSLSAWRERFRSGRIFFLPESMEVSCAFCQRKATEEIFVGWANPPGATNGPPMAQFARVCIDHVGHSRFTRSERPVDEL